MADGLSQMARKESMAVFGCDWATDWPDDKPPLPSTECVWWDEEEPKENS